MMLSELRSNNITESIDLTASNENSKVSNDLTQQNVQSIRFEEVKSSRRESFEKFKHPPKEMNQTPGLHLAQQIKSVTPLQEQQKQTSIIQWQNNKSKTVTKGTKGPSNIVNFNVSKIIENFESKPKAPFSGSTPNLDYERVKKKLPMFFEKILYPHYDKNMTQYMREANILAQYMSEVYSITYGYDKRGLLDIPLAQRWLKGEEYAFLNRHYKTYSAVAGFTVNLKSQDPEVYERPRSKQNSHILIILQVVWSITLKACI